MSPERKDNYKLQRDAFIANFLDAQFLIPYTNIRFGIDPILGLIPGIGDACSAIISFYFVYRAWEERMPKRFIALMIFNILLDGIIGLIPLIGDALDVMFKANLRNYEILKRHILTRTD